MKWLLWSAAVLLLIAAVMLIAGVGKPGLWFAVVALGVAVVIIERTRSHHRA